MTLYTVCLTRDITESAVAAASRSTMKTRSNFTKQMSPIRHSLSGSSGICLKNPIARTKRKYVNSAAVTTRCISRTSCLRNLK